VIGDFNGDHKPDIAVVCQYGSQISVLFGNGDGSFRPPVLNGPFPTARGRILALDVNGDGRTDLLLTSFGQQVLTGVPTCFGGSESGHGNDLIPLISKGDGNFNQLPSIPTGGFYTLWGASDLNGDGIPDLLFNDDTQLDVGFMLGVKGGTFSPLTSISTTPGLCSNLGTVADFQNNRKPDLIVNSGNFDGSSPAVFRFANNGNLSFAMPVALVSSTNQSLGANIQTAAADFNGDGILDLGISTEFANAAPFFVLFGTTPGAFKQAPGSLNLFPASQWLTLDINGDGKADLAELGSGGLHFYLSNGDGTFQHIFYGPGVADFVADFNGDGKPDLGGVAGNSVVVMINTTVFASVTGALNGASFAKGQAVTPGSLATIFGSGFTAPNVNGSASSIPLPLTLQNVSVTMGGIPAPLLFVNATQINVQVPWELTGSTADIVVTANGTALPRFHAPIAPAGPGIFTTQSGTGQAIAINNADGSLAGPSGSIPGVALHPASAGDVLLILCTGLGAVSPNVADGAAASDAVRNSLVTPTVLIGGQPAQVLFSGLTSQFVGVNQINVVVPDGVTGTVPLQISLAGITTSDQVTVAIQ